MRAYYEFAKPMINNNMYDALLDGSYAVINPQNIFDLVRWDAGQKKDVPITGGWWGSAAANGDVKKHYRDHTGDNGAVMVVNAGKVKNDMYRRMVTLEAGATYKLSAWLFMVQGPGRSQFSLRETDDSAILAQSPLYTVIGSEVGNWAERTWSFAVPANCGKLAFSVALSNMDPATQGNDLFIDDIELIKIPGNPNNTSISTVTCGNPAIKVPSVNPGDDVAATTPGKTVTINVKGNDTATPVGSNGVPISDPKPGSKKPGNGSIVIRPDGQIDYIPNPGFEGTDTFTYEVCTVATPQFPTVACSEATVSVFVGTPTAMASDDTGTVPPGQTSTTINLTGNDTSSNLTVGPIDPASVTPVKAPANGTVTYDKQGNVVYTPTPGFVGTDVFTYQVCTAPTMPQVEKTCDSANVTVHVPASKLVVNPQPDSAATEVDKPVTIKILSNDESNDPANAPLNKLAKLTSSGSPTKGIVKFNPDGTVVYTPNPDTTGEDTFTYQVCTDAKSPPYNVPADNVCENATVTVNVLPKPVIHPGDDSVSISPNETVTINVRANDTATPTNDTTVTVGYPQVKRQTNGQEDPAAKPKKGAYTIDADGNIRYTPTNGATGFDTFVYTICTEPNEVHPQAVCGDATVTVYIGDPKVDAGDDSVTTKRNVPVVIDLLVNDKSRDETNAPLVPSSTKVTKQPDNGTVTIDPVTGKATFEPNTGFVGTNVFTYEVCNALNPARCESANVTVYVAPPQLTVNAGNNAGETEMNKPVVINVLADDKVLGDNAVQLNQKAKPVKGPKNGVVSYNPDGSATYVPNTDFVGEDTFTYEVCTVVQPPYQAETCAQAVVTVNVSTPTVTATAVPKAKSMKENEPVTFPIFEGDKAQEVGSNKNVPLEPSTFRIVTKSAKGTVSAPDANGNVIFTPNPGASGEDYFEYEICTKIEAPHTESKCARAKVSLSIEALPVVDPGTPVDPGNGGTDPGNPNPGGPNPGTPNPGTPDPAGTVSVPVNSTWALMLAALAMAGFAARRAQRARQ